MSNEDDYPGPAPGDPGSSGSPPPRKFPAAWTAIGVAVLVLLSLVLIIRHIQHVSGEDIPNPRGRGAGRAGGGGAPTPVSVADAATGDIQLLVPALGTVTPLATVTIRTQISGILQKISFTEGQLVRRGDLLAQIDPRPYDATRPSSRTRSST
jgi:multidrug efflux system membrane fusion protein